MGKARGSGRGGRTGGSPFARPDLIAMEEDVVRRNRRSEYSFSVSADGFLTEINRGTDHNVPLAIWAYTPGATATHLHPGNYSAYGGAMSDRDVAIALGYGINLRAFGKAYAPGFTLDGYPIGPDGSVVKGAKAALPRIWRAEVYWPKVPTVTRPTRQSMRDLERTIARERGAYNRTHPFPDYDPNSRTDYYRAERARGTAFLSYLAGKYGARYRFTIDGKEIR